MSKKTPTRRNPSGNGIKSRLRSHQTPLRRSPRFLSQKNDQVITSRQPSSIKKPNNFSAGKTHLRSLQISPDSEEISSDKKTQQGYSEKSQKKPLRSIKTLQGFRMESQRKPAGPLRRSMRLASNSAEVTEKPIGNQKAVAEALQNLRRSPRFASTSVEVMKKEVTKDVNLGVREVKKRRWQPVRSVDSVKVSGKVKVGVDGLNDKMGYAERERGKRDSPVILKIGEGGEKRRRKIERNCKEKIGSEEIETAECCGFKGWMKEQAAALQRAYLAVKPSPHFWKKVSKMVPGKSAQECFDRVHASLATPSQPQPHSKRKSTILSPVGKFSLSGSKSTQHTELKVKRLSSRKKSLVAQKTIRHLLRKHCLVDQSNEADHFSVLETSPTALAMNFPEMGAPTTPDCISSPPGFLQKCSGRLSSAHQKALSRFKNLAQEIRPSPEVLKRIKNMALHEKYIDQLHCREARRNFAKAASRVAARDSENEGELKTGVLKAARTALISEAREVIGQFQHMQANSLDNIDYEDNDDDGDDDDDDE